MPVEKPANPRLVTSDFTPPKWARNRHVQTIWPRFFQKRLPMAFRRQRLTLPDNDFVELAWGVEVERPKGLVVIFHGLEGSVKSHYANDLMAVCQRQGWLPVLMHFRGCGTETNLTTRAYHSGETQDALFFLNWLKQQFPKLPKVAVGFSLGANMLLKLLGENPDQSLIQAAVAVSPPLRLHECAKSINSGFSRLYQWHLMTSMLANLKDKMSKIDFSSVLSIKQDELHKLKTFRDFDQHVTAPLHGFEGADDYYQQCSAMDQLTRIMTPTLILHAKDDPFMNEHVVPTEQQLSPMIRFELSDNGGHVGFLQGTPLQPTTWLHQRIPEYLSDYLDQEHPAQEQQKTA